MVKKVLDILSKASLHLKSKKCEFHKIEVKYLGLIISAEGIKIDPKQVKAIVEWGSPKILHDLQAFLGFSNFYRLFILGYSELVAHMIKLTKKDVKFIWNEDCKRAFNQSKNEFISVLVLMHFNAEKDIIIETDTSDYVSVGIMLQYDDNRILHLWAYFSKKHSLAKCNYKTYDKELMAIIQCFEEWRLELRLTPHHIRVISGYQNPEYFMSTKLLSCRQAR